MSEKTGKPQARKNIKRNTTEVASSKNAAVKDGKDKIGTENVRPKSSKV